MADQQQFKEVRFTGEKISKIILSKMVLCLFEPQTKAKLMNLRAEIVDENHKGWYELEKDKFNYVFSGLQNILSEKFAFFTGKSLFPY